LQLISTLVLAIGADMPYGVQVRLALLPLPLLLLLPLLHLSSLYPRISSSSHPLLPPSPSPSLSS
jgi:tRNA G10  N-methylase Trm11